LEWRTKVELFEQIRREYEFGVATISGVAKKLNIHRRMVREAIGSLPVPRKKVERPRWKLAAAIAFVDQILEADKKAPRKQRHTAHRIWERIHAPGNLEADWAEAGADIILRRCPICEQDSIVGHGRRRKQAHDAHHDWIGIRRGLCRVCY
jgi:hypothetical protein